MFSLILLFIITIAISLFYREALALRLKQQEVYFSRSLNKLNRLKALKKDLNSEGSLLNKNFDDILGLYELTKDLCKSLEGEKIFSIFTKHLKNISPSVIADMSRIARI